MISVGGNVCVRNGIELDYCFREAIESLLPVCDTVTVCDGESTDGTQEFLREWAMREPKIKLCVYPWPDPTGDIEFWVKWLNYSREHIKEDFHIQLDADEILSEKSYDLIGRLKKVRNPSDRIAYWCNRYNFWKDPKHLIPHGHCCSHRVVRFAPQELFLPSDGANEKGNEVISLAVNPTIPIEIFHYGFLREREAFFEKARKLAKYFFARQFVNQHDQRLVVVEQKPGNWMEKIEGVEWTNQLLPFDGEHPLIARKWLHNRGWET